MRELPAPLRGIPADVPGLWDTLRARFEKLGRAPRVVIHGGYGKNNMGDDAILHVIRGRVLTAFSDAEIHVVCHGPERVVARYRDDPAGPVTSSHFKSMTTVRAAVRSDLYIIGGGGIVNRINAYSGNMVFKALDPKGKFQFLASILAGWTGAFTLYYAIGAESFPDAVVRTLTRLALKRASVVSARDPRTVRNLREIGVKREIVEVLDPALSLEPASPQEADALLAEIGAAPRAGRTRPLVGMNFRWVGDPAVNNDRTLSEAARTARYLDEHGCDVVFLPISQHPDKHLEDDLDFGRRLREELGAPAWFALLERYPHPVLYMALLGACDALVLSRLHAVILGTMMGVPIAVVTYDDKVSEFVKLSGQEARMIDLADFTLERLEPVLRDVIAPVTRPAVQGAGA
jgi:polysaccharide pyruvyl transferase WcaK-like protein